MRAEQTRRMSIQDTPEIGLTAPVFDPNKYLAVTHANTSYSNLQDELKELKRVTSDKTEQLKALVSAHFDQYLTCHEAVRALSDDVRSHQRESEQLRGDMAQLKQITDSTLSVMLQRAKEQRRIRNTLAVLQRFRPIFEITTTMTASLEKQEYAQLAEDYCRLSVQSAKINLTVLQPVLTAAREIAKRASTELLAKFDGLMLSVPEQKRAITVLETLGFEEKPALTCLSKQADFFECHLTSLQGEDKDAEEVVAECAAAILRFRTGLWGLLCDIFEPDESLPNSHTSWNSQLTSMATTASHETPRLTSVEAEMIQQKAWHVLSLAVELMKKKMSPPTPTLLYQLDESIREIYSLRKCANATQLDRNVKELKSSFCDKFLIKVVLQFLQQECSQQSDQLLAEYFEVLPSLGSTANSNATTTTATPPGAQLSGQPKVAQLIAEACDAFDELRDTSIVSSESKIQLARPTVFSSCASDLVKRWEKIWKHVGPLLMKIAEGMESGRSAQANVGATVFRGLIVAEFKFQLHTLLGAFLEKIVQAFTAVIVPPKTMASVAGAACKRDGPGVCILFAIISNCIELRDKHFATVEHWIHLLSGPHTDPSGKANAHTTALHQLTLDVEAKCLDAYVVMHSEPLLRVLRAGAAEEALQARSSSAGPSNTRTDSMHLDSRGDQVAVGNSNSVPQDSRQYVFNVLLQLITLRSDVETSLSKYPQCPAYVHAVSVRLTTTLAQFLEDSVSKLDTTPDRSFEWLRINLLVEVRFFLFALRDLVSSTTKNLLVSLERSLVALERPRPSHSEMPAPDLALLAQLKRQTKLYQLALQQE